MKELWFVAACSIAVFAQSEDILAKARKALGGDAKLKAVRSIVATGSYNHADMEVSFLLPDKFLKEETISLPNGMVGPVLLEGLDGETAWNDTRQSGNMMIRMKMDGDDAAHLAGAKVNFARYTLAMLLSAPGSLPLQFTPAGEAEAPDGKADVVDAQGDKFSAKLFIDKTTHMPLMMSYRTAQMKRVMMHRAPPISKTCPSPSAKKSTSNSTCSITAK